MSAQVTQINARSASTPAADEVTLCEGFEDMPIVMSPKTLAEQLDISTTQLGRMRKDGTGPAFSQMDGSLVIRYARVDVVAWFRSNMKNKAV